MPILSTRLGMMYVCRDLSSTSGRHRLRKQLTLPGCTWDMHFPLQPYENPESQPAFPSRRLGFERPPRRPDDSSKKQNARDVLTISNVLFMQRGRREEFRSWEKKNVSDLPGRLESYRCRRGNFSFSKLLDRPMNLPVIYRDSTMIENKSNC